MKHFKMVVAGVGAVVLATGASAAAQTASATDPIVTTDAVPDRDDDDGDEGKLGLIGLLGLAGLLGLKRRDRDDDRVRPAGTTQRP
ncbi:WGxxGxxG family protein [Sphingomonas sp. LY29]|uniref:WGxxGxxG family protein n=1 Tax=Sphingomonas sp. LY29 TaxID=3095341 RepID=UPI002D775162|nr:WGxxGxxG family protein [Sphingomonas sp. LY29]WRP26647.1 WGxxGxxG family protein [Sphingomonas sp. LY29]